MSLREVATRESPVVMSSRKLITQEQSFVDSPRLATTENLPIVQNSKNVVSKKPPPAPRKSPCEKKTNALKMTHSDIPMSSNLTEERHPRSVSSLKSASSDSRDKKISSPGSVSSSETNLHLLTSSTEHLGRCGDNVLNAPKSYSETSGDNRRNTRDFSSPEFVHPDVKEKSVRKGEFDSKERYELQNSKHQSVTDLDQNLNKQIETLNKTKVFEEVAENALGTNDVKSFIYSDESAKYDIIKSPTRYKNVSTSENNKTFRKVNGNLPDVPCVQEHSKLTDNSTTKTTEVSSNQMTCPDEKAVNKKELTQEQSRLETNRSLTINGTSSEYSESDVEPVGSSTSIANFKGANLQNPNVVKCLEGPRLTPGYQGSVYDYYYKDEMTFPSVPEIPKYGGVRPLKFPHRCSGHKSSRVKTAQPRVLRRPHRGIIFFQPHSFLNGDSSATMANEAMKWRARYKDWEDRDGDFFPSYHRLQSSADLNRHMKMVMRFHNCRELPKIGTNEERRDTIQPRLFFNSHGWFPRSTTGVMQVKYRDTVAQMKRLWYDTWYREVNFRNAVKEPMRRRQFAYDRPEQTKPVSPTRGYPNPTPVTPYGEEQSFPNSKRGSALDFDDRDGGCYTSPTRPVTTPPSVPTEGLGTSSQEAKSASDSIRSISKQSADFESRSYSPAAHRIHSKGNSTYSDSEVNAQRRSADLCRGVQKQQRHQQQQEQGRRISLEIETGIHQGQAGDSIRQTTLPEIVKRCLPMEQSDALFTELSKFSGETPEVGNNDRGERLVATTLQPNPDSGDKGAGPGQVSVCGSKENVSGISQKKKNPGRCQDKMKETHKEVESSLSWEIKHLDFMLNQAKKGAGKKNI